MHVHSNPDLLSPGQMQAGQSPHFPPRKQTHIHLMLQEMQITSPQTNTVLSKEQAFLKNFALEKGFRKGFLVIYRLQSVGIVFFLPQN